MNIRRVLTTFKTSTDFYITLLRRNVIDTISADRQDIYMANFAIFPRIPSEKRILVLVVGRFDIGTSAIVLLFYIFSKYDLYWWYVEL